MKKSCLLLLVLLFSAHESSATTEFIARQYEYEIQKDEALIANTEAYIKELPTQYNGNELEERLMEAEQHLKWFKDQVQELRKNYTKHMNNRQNP